MQSANDEHYEYYIYIRDGTIGTFSRWAESELNRLQNFQPGIGIGPLMESVSESKLQFNAGIGIGI